MQYALVIYDEETAEKDVEPFFTLENMPVWYVFAGIQVFSPYPSVKAASDAGRTLDRDRYTWSVKPIRSRSKEELDDPAGVLWNGDSPDA